MFNLSKFFDIEKYKELENILKPKAIDFGEFLISVCLSEENKKIIEENLINVSIENIFMFMIPLYKNMPDSEIEKYLLVFNINNNEENFIEIKKYINYFIEIKEIINDSLQK